MTETKGFKADHSGFKPLQNDIIKTILQRKVGEILKKSRLTSTPCSASSTQQPNNKINLILFE